MRAPEFAVELAVRFDATLRVVNFSDAETVVRDESVPLTVVP
ncbi:hypothetical protein [Halogeometricum limi]|nr:hypothetical protein [Halogeometricum limi]